MMSPETSAAYAHLRVYSLFIICFMRENLAPCKMAQRGTGRLSAIYGVCVLGKARMAHTASD